MPPMCNWNHLSITGVLQKQYAYGGMHVGIRKNFKETDYGLARNDGKKINTPPAVVNEADT